MPVVRRTPTFEGRLRMCEFANVLGQAGRGIDDQDRQTAAQSFVQGIEVNRVGGDVGRIAYVHGRLALKTGEVVADTAKVGRVHVPQRARGLGRKVEVVDVHGVVGG